jgi:hypothetical protein
MKCSLKHDSEVLLEENVSTLLHAVLILITVHDLPRVLT